MPSRLKSLELHGYKTFASRTMFAFSGKVTAIVGPNGSGKSNIADSLRWVLGEQSYSLLRGRKTEDMIFSGSEHRSRAGMASATITFDNSDGWLPIDFTEVAVTRRAYRDGQNEYLINRQRVRLKDVAELLAKSGLAERTYTIIGQGLVDAALALKAEERRRLFEEAAGTGLHRARREEALRRLDTTCRNMERIQDILAELSPRLRSLERQARRAVEYEEVKANLRVLLREWYGYQWHSAQKDLAQARESAQAQESALTQARQEQEEIEAKGGALRDRAQGLRNDLNNWHRQSSQLHTRREAISKELAVASERARAMLEQQQNAKAELVRVQEEIGLQQERLAEAGQEVIQLKNDLDEARIQVETSRKALAARQEEQSQADRTLQKSRRALSDLMGRKGQLQAKLSERRAQAGRAQKALNEAIRAVETAEQEQQRAEARSLEAGRLQRAADSARKQAEEAYQTHHQKLAQAEAARKDVVERRSTAAAELARINAQLDVLEQAEKSLTGYTAGTRLLLQASRQSRLKGTRGALSSYLEVPAEVETAVSAALGEYLDSVLLDEDPDQALDLLSKQAVRGVLLPLQGLKPSLPASFSQGQRDILGVAAELVKAPPELRPVVDLILGPVLIVKDRSAARKALVGQPSQVRAVTLSGEVFLASGPVLTSGVQNGSKGQNLLGRQRQQRELSQKRAGAETQLDGLNQELRRLEDEIGTLHRDSLRLDQEQRAARKQAEQAHLAADKARLNVDQARRQAGWQQEQRQRLEADIRRSEGESSAIMKELEGLEADISQAREIVREHTSILAGLSLSEFQSQVNHWNTVSAVAERALADASERRRDRQGSLVRAQQQEQKLLARQGQLQTDFEALECGQAEQREIEGQIGKEVDALRLLIEPAEADLVAVEQELKQVQTAESATRQAVSQAEHHNAQARILLARRQEALENLRRRIEDDFGLVAFEYTQETSGPNPLPLEGMVEQLPLIKELSAGIDVTIKQQQAHLRRLGAINPEAKAEYQEVKERFDFLTSQLTDLRKAESDIRQLIAELDALMEREFLKTFNAVTGEFSEIFTRLFGGGTAQLVLTDPKDLTNTGIDIEARLPGRRTQGLSLLSGGERSLTATALVFALLRVSPTPFCVLDEVDAMLDEANVARFRELLSELSENTQFVLVTHNRNTVQVADVIYGVTMGRDLSSQILSLRLDQVEEIVPQS